MKNIDNYIKNKYKNFGKFANGYYQVTIATPEELPTVNPYIDLYTADYGLQGKWGLCDAKGNELIKPQYLFPLHKFDDLYMVSIGVEDDGIINEMLSGLVDENNKEIIPIKYRYMTWLDDDGVYFKVWDKELEKDGILDNRNNIVVPFKYDYISEFLKYDQIEIKNGNLNGIYDLRLNKEIIKPKYEKDIEIVNYNLFAISDEQKKIFINEKEKIVREERFLC